MDNTLIFVLINLLFTSLCEARIVWRNDFNIRSTDLEEDLERIPSKMLASLGLLVDVDKMEPFESLMGGQPEVREEYKEVPLREYDYQIDYEEDDRRRNPSKKRLAGEADYDTTERTIMNGTDQEVEYDLESFKKDYENRLPEPPDIASIAPISNMSAVDTQPQPETPFRVTKTEEYSASCSNMSLWKYYFFGVPCFLHEVRFGKILKAIILLLKTTLIVFPTLLLISLCLWCYNGMCSCIFPFEIFHPYREIIKIKKAAYITPPGVFYDEDGTECFYKPTQQEVECYYQLLKMIRS